MRKESSLQDACQACSKICCRQDEVKAFGTMLFPAEKIALETHVGKPLTIRPMVAIESNGERGVLVYQLLHEGERCPALSENGLCAVYALRPLMCKAFPFFGPLLNKACPYTPHYQKHEDKLAEQYLEEKRAAILLGNMLFGALERAHAVVYLFRDDIWVAASRVSMDTRGARWHEWRLPPRPHTG